jgi:hypothetical protein
MPRWEAVVLVAAAGLMIGWRGAKLMFEPCVGAIVVKTDPCDATVSFDDVTVGTRWPTPIEKPEGKYTLSVTRAGYTASHQVVEVRSDHTTNLLVTLEPSPDTGFELTSEPPGQLVWVDGVPFPGGMREQARTDFRAFRIAPGHHVIEIRGDRYRPWQQDVEVSAGTIVKVHAVLIRQERPTPGHSDCFLCGPLARP